MKPRPFVFACALAATAAPFSCVLSEPAPLVKPPVRRPSILHGQEFPASARVLLEDPGTFYVPVEVVDPTTTYSWEVLLDFPAKPVEQARVLGLQDTIEGSATRANVQSIPFSLTDRLKDNQCHQITFHVGLSLAANDPKSVDSDFATWFFVPEGKSSKCVPFDGGLPDGSYDSGSDVGAEP